MLIHKLKTIRYEFLLFITNKLVAHVPSKQMRLFFYRKFFRLKIGQGSFIFMGVWFNGIGNIEIGENSIINQNCKFANNGSIKIGSNTSISSEVFILTADHDLHSSSFIGRIKPVIVEDYVFIGTRAIIMPGVTLNKGCAVAAGAIVLKDVPAYTIVAGVPAKPIGKRPTELNYNCHYPRFLH
ncbi:MAG TPA: acyltransferase [Nostoc sp.]|uniref:acyltransferase n=1 Tax=Nostoc sp. TaxID=1180 RepID=UPI002D24A8CF|nr:acyltransferase [Nostoc sp.]HYX18487.1 acyltransferase [Nostoc sp.]